MDLYAKFKDGNPDGLFLDADNPQALQTYLADRGWIGPHASIRSLTKAGEGNMNKVLRVRLDDGASFIVKQARPWVEKFPDIPAPAERADIEGQYYEQTGRDATLAAFSPTLEHADTRSHILMLEDLGEGSDLTDLYQPGAVIGEDTLAALLDYLSALHTNFNRHLCDFYIENHGMRALNAEHIFRFPFLPDNGLDLDEITPGLAALAARYRDDAALMEQVGRLRDRYLQNGDTLLQGDYYPGSFLDTRDGVKVIDTEFCFFGDAEFDLGILYAHLMLAQQPEPVIGAVLGHYRQPAQFSERRFRQYTGIEIMRRLLGLAQLPLALDLTAKHSLLDQARALLVEAETG